MKKIIIHWTGGASTPCSTDLLAYHYLVDKFGKIYKGVFSPEDNENCKDGKYAHHCGGGNTCSIGVSMCGMFGFQSRYNSGKFLLTEKQCSAMFSFVAKLCKSYSIEPKADSVMTHYEFGLKNPHSSSSGKIDIVYLPPFPDLYPYEIGDFIRNKIETELCKIL